MKRIFFFIVFGLGLIGLCGCYAIPRHYVTQEIIIYYPAPPPQPEYYPRDLEPWPDPDYPPRPNPPSTDPVSPRDRKPEQPKDSYDKRDPLQGSNHRGGDEIKTYPPVRTPEQKDRGSQ